jgi:hypothetical protein
MDLKLTRLVNGYGQVSLIKSFNAPVPEDWKRGDLILKSNSNAF